MKTPITIFYNARIHTLKAGQPRASAIAIQNDRIVACGSAEEVLAEFEGWPGEREDLQGQIILPGLTDAHIHLMYYSLGLQKVDCETSTRSECLRRVAERVLKTPPGEWVLGHGWNQNNWPEGFGSAADLDAFAPDQPVYLTAKSLHAAWANTKALQLAGLNDQTPDPEGGKLGRDSQGRLNGILYETAMQMASEIIPAPTPEQALEALRQAQPILWQMGLTGAHDFDRRACFAALQQLHLNRELKLRVLKSLPLEELEQALALGLSSGFGDDMLRIGSIKAFADGALGPQTAAMLQPYENDADNRGMLMMDAEELFEHARQAAEGGLSMAVHAIGDRANHEVLQAFGQLRSYERSHGLSPARPLRHRIEHVQVLHPDDAGRLAQLDIIASMQPLHATSDMLMADRYWGKRSTLAYAWRTQLQQGARLAFGSDAPVESPNPFWGLHAAVTRQRQDGVPGEQGWYPEQRLTLGEAVRAYTSGAAYAADMEDRLGMLAPGYLADLLVLERDPFTVPVTELPDLKPVRTMLGGEWVWRSA